jgi:cell division control protein 7
MSGMKAYFRCMFRALRDIHARGLIHRDVKPANFLFDPRTGVGTLCDFGLACVRAIRFTMSPVDHLHATLQRMEPGPSLGACLHTRPTREYPHGVIRHKREYDINHIKKMQKEARHKSSLPSERVGYLEKDTRCVKHDQFG